MGTKTMRIDPFMTVELPPPVRMNSALRLAGGGSVFKGRSSRTVVMKLYNESKVVLLSSLHMGSSKN